MPEIVESFEDLKEHASYCHFVLYRINPMAEGKFRVRGASRKVRVRQGPWRERSQVQTTPV